MSLVPKIQTHTFERPYHSPPPIPIHVWNRVWRVVPPDPAWPLPPPPPPPWQKALAHIYLSKEIVDKWVQNEQAGAAAIAIALKSLGYIGTAAAVLISLVAFLISIGVDAYREPDGTVRIEVNSIHANLSPYGPKKPGIYARYDTTPMPLPFPPHEGKQEVILDALLVNDAIGG